MAASVNGRIGWRPAARDGLRRLVPLAALVGIVLAIVLLAGMGDIVLQRRVIFCLIHVVAVVGLYIFMGNSGVMNFSSAGFMAVGAYTSALLTMAPGMKSTFLPDLPAWLAAAHLSPLWGALAGGVVAGLLALVIGIPIMRLSGIGAAIATLSLMFICYIVLGNWTALTGGQQSLMGLPSYVGLWTAGLTAMAAIAVAFVYQETRGALALRGSREDEVAARGSGVRIVRERLVAFVVSGFVTGIAGVLGGSISLFTTIATLLFLRTEKPNALMLAGVLVGFAGIVLIARPWEGTDRTIDITGVLWMLAATTILGVSYVYVRRFLSPYNLPPLALATWQMGLALLVLLAVADRTGMSNIMQNWHAAAGVAIGLGVLGTGTAFLIYYYLLQELGAVAASGATYITPNVALLIGWGAGEKVGVLEIAAIILVLASIAMLQIGRQRAMQAATVTAKTKDFRNDRKESC